MSRLNRSDISRVLYGSQTVNLIRKGRIQIYPAPEFTEVYLLDDNKMYSVQVTETGDYLLSDDYLVTDTSLYEYLPPYVVVDPDKTGQWILSTQSRHSDMSETTYFMSNSNYNVNDGTARVKVTVQGIQSLALKYGCYSQYNDYVNLWTIDYDASSENETTSSVNSVANTSSKYNSSAPNLTYTYALDGGEHFFWVTYGKSSSGNSYEDRGYIGIATSLLQDRTVNNVDVYYEIAPDDYFFSGGVFREKLVASDGSEPLPGNVLQSRLSERAEAIDVDGTMYKAFYYYVTIKGVEIKASEYVLGEEITFFDVRFSFTEAELQAMSPGDKIYYDESNNRLTTTAGSNTMIGTVFWDYNSYTYDGIPCRRVAGHEILNANYPDTGHCDTNRDPQKVKIAQDGTYGATHYVCATSSKCDGYHNCCAWYDLLETLSDKSWKTASTINNSTDLYPAMMLAYRYHTPGTYPGYWYIPASANQSTSNAEKNYNSEYYWLWYRAIYTTSSSEPLNADRFGKKTGYYDHQSSYEYSADGAAMFSVGQTYYGYAWSTTQKKNAGFGRWPVMQLWPKERMVEKSQSLTYYHLND